MKRLFFLIMIPTFFGISNTNAQQFDNIDDAWKWYKNLDPFIQIEIERNNDYKKIKKKEILDFLPVKEIDVSGLHIYYNLDFLKDFSELERLSLPSSIQDYSLLKSGYFENLVYLSIESHKINSQMLKEFDIPKLKSINIMDSKVKSLDFVSTFPLLTEIYLRENQIDKTEINKYPDITFSNPKYPVLARKDWNKTDFNKYINEIKYPFKAAENGIDGEVKILLHVEPNGTISKMEKITNIGYGLEEEFMRIASYMKFTPVDSLEGVEKIEISMKYKSY